jgi:hypothetical protein
VTLRAVTVVVFWLLCLAADSSVRADSSKDDWFDDACVETSDARWCAPKLRAGGWLLKYKTESPKDLADVFWRIEVWVKGSDALVCELKGGRGGLRSNGCYSLTDVSN